MFVIGLTGGIGSGKSEVERLFRTLDIEVIEADSLAKEIVAPGTDVLNNLIARLGPELLLPDGALNRRLLRTRMFQDPSIRAFVEAMIHPHVRSLFQERLKTVRSPYAVFSVPLLLEHHLEFMVNRVLVIDADPTLQISRATARDNVSQEDVHAIMAVQISRQERLERADDLILNEGSLEDLKAAILKLHEHYLSLC